MEQGLKAFFYDYKYYLLPEEMQSVEEIKAQKVVEVKRLKEELCMAPNFIYESMETELLSIEAPERVFPAEVNLYTSEEYDAILWKQVLAVCQNCERFIDDEDDDEEHLDGHHREISLDGVCYIKETKEECWSFTRCVDCAWYRIAKKTKELTKFIDKNKHEKVQEIVSAEFGRFFLPNEVLGGVDEEGNYFLAFYANDYGDYGLRLVLKMIAEMANCEDSPMAEAGWKVYPFLPKGALPKTRKPDYINNTPRFFVEVDELEGAMQVWLYDSKLAKANEKKQNEIKTAAYEYMAYCVGEDVLLGGCYAYSAVGEIPNGATEVTLEELEKLLFARAKPDENVPEPLFPAPLFREAYPDGEEPEMLPFKKDLQLVMTNCPDMSPEKLNENMEGGNTGLEQAFGILYAYLYMPHGSDIDAEWKRETLFWYLSNLKEYPQPISDGVSDVFMKGTGMTITKEGTSADVMVFDEKNFFRWMRHLTPVLKGLNVKIVMVKKGGTSIYEPNYRIVAEGSDWLN